MRMKYIAPVTFEVKTFVECEGDDMLIDVATERLDEEAERVRILIQQRTSMPVKTLKIAEMSGAPVTQKAKGCE